MKSYIMSVNWEKMEIDIVSDDKRLYTYFKKLYMLDTFGFESSQVDNEGTRCISIYAFKGQDFIKFIFNLCKAYDIEPYQRLKD